MVATKKTWKLSPLAKRRAMDLFRLGGSVKSVAEQLSTELNVMVSPQAIWQYRSRNAAKLQLTVSDELETAVALRPIARLDERLAELEAVIAISTEGREWLLRQLSRDDLTGEDRREAIRVLGQMSSGLGPVLAAVKTAGEMVDRARSLALGLKRQTQRKDGRDRDEVEQAILRVQARQSQSVPVERKRKA